tara:strand:- start:173 stop:583 length:411 start_codon:yes stop_codon:yes gene_type:complete
MSKQTLTNQELVDLANGLHTVKDLKGVKFALVVAKNMDNLQKELKHIEDASKPDAAFLEVAQKVQELNQTGKEEEAKELEKKHKDLEDTRKKQMVEVQELLKEESTVQIYTIYSNQLPNDISAEQIMKINKIIIDN